MQALGAGKGLVVASVSFQVVAEAQIFVGDWMLAMVACGQGSIVDSASFTGCFSRAALAALSTFTRALLEGQRHATLWVLQVPGVAAALGAKFS